MDQKENRNKLLAGERGCASEPITDSYVQPKLGAVQ